MPYCYLNGAIVPLSEAKVGVYDIGLLRGLGIYEALVVRGGVPFRLSDHLERFRRSAKELGLMVPVGDEEIARAVQELVSRNGYTDAVVRMILTGGEAIGGIEYDVLKPTFYILVEAFVPLNKEYFTSGASLISEEHLRQLPGLKTTNYIQAATLQAKRKDAHALEILYTHNGLVLECATSNFFIVKNGVVVTPNTNILEGITRKVVLELLEGAQIPAELRDITVEEIFAADEAFLTSSFKDVVPVVQIDGRAINNRTIGPVTQSSMQLFADYIRGGASH